MDAEDTIPLPDSNTLLVIMIIIIVIPLIIEVGILTYSWYHADEVKCNFLWCEFIERRGTSNITSYQECYENNVRINCTGIPEPDWEKVGGIQ